MNLAAEPVLSVSGVSKRFGSKIAVNNLTLDINKGDVFGFLGPNGAGKTTTIRIILNVLRASSGSVQLFGQDSQLTKATHRRLGYLSGEMVLDGDLTAEQYLNFVSYQYGGGHDKRIRELAQLLHINLDSRIDSYSRGNRQKISLIAALSHNPELLILDEPTSGFDPLVQETFMELIKKYQAKGGTVFMSSHTLSEVQRLCNRVAFIKDGSLVGVKDIEELRKTSTKTITLIAKAEVTSAVKAKIKKIPEVKILEASKSSLTLSFSGDITKILRLLANFSLDDLTITEPELEEVFIGYYKNPGAKK